MSKINNLQPKVVDNLFQPIPTTSTKSANANPTDKQANAAINQLTNRFVEMQNAQLQQTDDLSKPVQINPKTDFKGKKVDKITQPDALRAVYEKLADKAKLNEPYRTEFINELASPKSNIVHLDTSTDFTDKEFAALKKGSFDITPSENTIKRLNEYQAEQNLPDQLLAKYQKPFGLDEAGLGKELAQLSTGNFREVQEVLNRLKSGETLINEGQSLRVANQMLGNMSDDQIALLAQKRNGNKFLKGLGDEIKAGRSGMSFDISSIVNSKRIDTAREKSLSNILGENSVSISDWEKNGLGGDETLDHLQVSDDDKKKAKEIFDRLYPDKKSQALVTVKDSEQSKELDYLGKLVAQNKYNAIIDKAVADIKPSFPQLDEKTLKALLIQESGLNSDPTQSNNNPSFRGIGQMNPDAARIGGITDEERLDPEKAIPASARILKNKADYLEGKVSQRAFIKYGRPQGEDYMKFTLASYNAGEGAIANAMDKAYQKGLGVAAKQNLTGVDAENFAKSYATKWDNLVDAENPNESPLRLATSAGKYREVTNYVDGITTLSKRKRQ
jgi:hypothetical protein